MDSGDSDFEDIELYFDSKYWEELSEFEKRRYLSIKRNYEVLISIGMNPPCPQFMNPKKPAEEILDFPKQARKISKEIKSEIKSEPEDDYESCQSSLGVKSKKSKPESLRKAKRNLDQIDQIVIIESRKLSQHEAIKKYDEPTRRYPKRNIPRKYYTNDYAFCLRDEIDREAPEERRYPIRNIAKKCYSEGNTYDIDVFTLSDVCDNIKVENNLISSPSVSSDDTKVPPMPYADTFASLNLPPFLTLCRSEITGKMFGVWANEALSKGVVFGPYHGAVIEKLWHVTYNKFAWKIYAEDENYQLIKYFNPSTSNWLHCVNCAMSEEHQNLIAFEQKGKIYYKTCKDVKPHTELLVWYRDSYKNEVGVDLLLKTEPEEYVSYECDLCHCVFTRRNQNKQGIEDSSGIDRKIVCPRCLSPKSGRWNLDPWQADAKPQCLICNQRFLNVSRLCIHMKIHTQKNVPECLVCHKKFLYKKQLERHTMIHEDKRPFVCDICGKGYSDISVLRRHVLSHTGDKKYKCSICSYRSAYSYHVRNHARRMHKRK